jgi:hypothetical protein
MAHPLYIHYIYLYTADTENIVVNVFLFLFGEILNMSGKIKQYQVVSTFVYYNTSNRNGKYVFTFKVFKICFHLISSCLYLKLLF